MSEGRELPNDPELNELRSRFLGSLGRLRPKLHRLCSLMCGSVLDGEDLVQETLAAASYKVSPSNPGFLDPSLFEMAYHRCSYFVRRDSGSRERTADYPDRLTPLMMVGHRSWLTTPIEGPLVSRVSELRIFDRAAIVLQDVLGFSRHEAASMLRVSAGHVGVRLMLARLTLRSLSTGTRSTRIDSVQLGLHRRFADCLNRLDGRGIHRLSRGDARLEIVGAFNGQLRDLDAVYAATYAAIPWKWMHSVAAIDGDPALITNRRTAEGWLPYSAIRLWYEGGQVVRIRDYMHIGHILRDARIEHAGEPPAAGFVVEHG